MATINGTSGKDTLTGTPVADTLNGLAGNDVLEGLGDADELNGGTGSDTISYGKSADGVDVGLADDGSISFALDRDAAGDTGSSIENITGSKFADALAGNKLANVLDGGGDIDYLVGFGGADTLKGGDGDDFLIGGVGADILIGGDGIDSVGYGAVAGNVTVKLGAGGAQTVGSGADAQGDKLTGIENIYGGDGDDVLTGNELANRIVGGDSGNDGDDTIEGGGGADSLSGGGGGIDTLSYSHSPGGVIVNLDTKFADGSDATGDVFTGFENILGSDFNDYLRGDAIANRLDGGAGNDSIEGGGDADILIGGTGSDTVDYFRETADLTVTLGANGKETIAQGGNAEGDKISGFENLYGGSGQDKLTGNNLANYIEGNNDDDTIAGGSGNDLLLGGGGADVLDGGTGIDIISYEFANAGVSITLANDGSLAIADGDEAFGDLGSNFEGITGSDFFDDLVGNKSANVLDGGYGNDQLVGGGGSDTLRGGDGNDDLAGGAGADALVGGDGNDDFARYTEAVAAITVKLGLGGAQTTASGGDAQGDKLSGIENIWGGSGNDVLRGNELDNWIIGDEGDDIIEGGAGADNLADRATIGGNPSVDTLSYEHSPSGVFVDFETSTSSGGDAAGDQFSNFENLLGSAFSDFLGGDGGFNRLDGGAGDDTIRGRADADILIGGAGIDGVEYFEDTDGVTVTLGVNGAQTIAQGGHAEGDAIAGFEKLNGGLGNDILTGNNLANRIFGTNGDDTVAGGGSNDILLGGFGADKLDGGAADDFLRGDDGADVLDGGAGIDTISYELCPSDGVKVSLADDGTFLVAKGSHAAGDTGNGIENIIGSLFDDALSGNKLANVLEGGDGRDALIGNGGADTLDGGEDNDNLSGGAGADALIGGDGDDDTAFYLGAVAGITVTLGANGARATASGGEAQGDKLSGIEHVWSGSGNDVLRGNELHNEIIGGAGDDIIEGGGGADALTGSDVFSDTGIDTLSYAHSPAGVSIDLTNNLAGDEDEEGDAAGDLISGFENLLGSKFDDTLQGTSGPNRIDGGAGNDAIVGLGGGDVLIGGAGIDDVFLGDKATGVTVVLRDNGAQVTVRGGIFEGDTISGFENVFGDEANDIIVGNNLANFLFGHFGDDGLSGGAGNDILNGADGKDTISGGAGNDTISGGKGADILDGGTGVDTLSYQFSSVGVTVSLAIAAASGGDATGDAIANFENVVGAGSFFGDLLTGDDRANELDGAFGDDELHGAGGNDILIGSSDDDTLEGGAGADRFAYEHYFHGADIITDFTAGSDKLQISKSGFFFSVPGSVLPASYFTTGLTATTFDHGQFIFDPTADRLYWDIDGTGANPARLLATFTNDPTLHASDFVLVA